MLGLAGGRPDVMSTSAPPVMADCSLCSSCPTLSVAIPKSITCKAPRISSPFLGYTLCASSRESAICWHWSSPSQSQRQSDPATTVLHGPWSVCPEGGRRRSRGGMAELACWKACTLYEGAIQLRQQKLCRCIAHWHHLAMCVQGKKEVPT